MSAAKPIRPPTPHWMKHKEKPEWDGWDVQSPGKPSFDEALETVTRDADPEHLETLGWLHERRAKQLMANWDKVCEACGDALRGQWEKCRTCDEREKREARDLDLKTIRDWHEGEIKPALESIPPRFRWATLDSPLLAERAPGFDPADVPPLDGWIAMLGDTGKGKTSVACALMRKWIDDYGTFGYVDCDKYRSDSGYRVVKSTCSTLSRAAGARFVSVIQMANERLAWPLGKKNPPMLQSALDATLLVLDDVGKEFALGELARSAVSVVLDHRHDHMKPTIITTGVPLSKLQSGYDTGYGRRILESTLVPLSRKESAR